VVIIDIYLVVPCSVNCKLILSKQEKMWDTFKDFIFKCVAILNSSAYAYEWATETTLGN